MKRKILIVEDTFTERMFLEKLLQKNGFDTVSVENGVKALEKLYSDSFDLILSDLMMPAMDGMELLQECQEKFHDIPFILITAFAEENENAIRALKNGAEDCVFKEFKNQELIARINKAMMNFEAKMNLKKSQKEVKTLIENLSDIVFSLNDEGKILYLSKQWFNILEKDIDEWEGKYFWEISSDENNKNEIKKFIKRTTKTGESLNNFEIITKHNNGNTVYLTINLATLKDNKDKIIKITGTAREVTEKKNLENKIEIYNKELEGIISSRTEELETVKNRVRIFKSAFDCSINPSFLINESHEIISANLSAIKLLQLDENKITGQKVNKFLIENPLAESVFKDLKHYNKKEGKCILTNSKELSTPCFLTAYTIKNDEGKVLGYVANLESV